MSKPGIGDRVPDASFKYLGKDGMETMSSQELFASKSVLLIGVVGAFTPICTREHLPEYLPFQRELKERGIIDVFACACVADPFVMAAWGRHLEVPEDVLLLTDNNAAFADGLGLAIDLSDMGLGRRSTRYALRAKDGVIDILNVEERMDKFARTRRGQIEDLING